MEQGSKASANTFRPRAGFGALIRQELVQEVGLVQSLLCNECREAHDAEVIFENDHYGYFCPEIGFVPIDRAKLVGIEPVLQNLVAELADALECKRRKTSPIHGQTWRIGAVETDSGDLVIYFHPLLLDMQHISDFAAALRFEPRPAFGLVLTARGSLTAPGFETVQLDNLIELDPATDALRVMTDIRHLAGVPAKRSGGRPKTYGSELTDLIWLRVNQGIALSGLNEEAKAIHAVFCATFPEGKNPSLSTVKRRLTKFRGGS